VSNITILEDVTTSILTENKLNKYLVFPNPATEFLHIKGYDIRKVTIKNKMGQIVSIRKASDQTGIILYVMDLSAGIYVIEIETINGILFEKVVIN
jgi:hypothetical protein